MAVEAFLTSLLRTLHCGPMLRRQAPQRRRTPTHPPGDYICQSLADGIGNVDDLDFLQDQLREIRRFISASLAEPALSVISGLDLGLVQQLALFLVGEQPSAVSDVLLNHMQGVVF